ncbi:MAG: LPS export ABC transporter periplasmic protein LptC [Endomicrobium sp.]|nr:LPS export ABC transporter periplasmic protein LptC [Endomicrobium sp.]
MDFCKRYNIWLITILFVFMFCGCNAEKIDIEETPPTSEQMIEKFTITEMREGKLEMILKAESAIVDESKNVAHLKFPVIKFYNEGNYLSTFVAESADINLVSYDIKGNGKCTVDSANNEHLQTVDLMYSEKEGLIYSNNPIKITRSGEKVYGTSFKSDTKLNKMVIKNQRISID